MVRDTQGKRIADFAWHPLWLKSYSAPFSGVVSREELLAHTKSDPERPERLTYDYVAQFRPGPKTEWGFTMPHQLVQSLSDEQYRVHIDAEFSEGNWMCSTGRCRASIRYDLFCRAHLPSGDRQRRARRDRRSSRTLPRTGRASERRWTDRLIIGPEYFAGRHVSASLRREESLRRLLSRHVGNDQRLGFARSHGAMLSSMSPRAMCPPPRARGSRGAALGMWSNDSCSSMAWIWHSQYRLRARSLARV